MTAESIVIPCVLTVFYAVLFAEVGPVFIYSAFVIWGQKITAGVDHDVPLVPVNIDGNFFMS